LTSSLQSLGDIVAVEVLIGFGEHAEQHQRDEPCVQIALKLARCVVHASTVYLTVLVVKQYRLLYMTDVVKLQLNPE